MAGDAIARTGEILASVVRRCGLLCVRDRTCAEDEKRGGKKLHSFHEFVQ
jgi:hypothetical protein